MMPLMRLVNKLHGQINSNLQNKVNKGDFYNVIFRKYDDENVAIWFYTSDLEVDAVALHPGGVNFSHSINGGATWTTIFNIPNS